MIKNMENPQRKEKKPQPPPIRIGVGGGGYNGAVLAWGGAMAVAGLIATFAIKRRRSKSGGDGAKKKEEQIKAGNVEEKQGEEGEADGEEGRLGLNDPLSQNQCCTTNHETAKMDVTQTNTKTQIDSSYMVSAKNSTLEEKAKPKDDSSRERPTNAHQQNVPFINYSIPSQQDEIIPFSSLKPAIQEIIPFNKLKPEFIAGILEEFKSPVIDIADPPLPMKEVKGPVERLIVKPLIHQVTLEAEALLSPIIEADEDNHEEDEDGFEVEVEEGDESAGEGEEASEVADESSSVCNDEAIWPAEAIEELAQEVKNMKVDFDRPREEDTEAENGRGTAKEHQIVEARKTSENFSEDDDNGTDIDDYNESETDSNVGMENQEEELVPLNNNQQEVVVATAVAQTAKLSRSRSSTWMWTSMFVMFLLALLLFRFDAMSCYLLNQ